jgi:hypothetical protein
MRRILAAFFFSVGVLAAPLIAQAAPCSPSMTYTTGQTLTASVLNSNPTTFSGCFNNIDYTNIGAAGFFASQMLPSNTAQATFGGSVPYTFANGLNVSGTLTAAVLAGLYPSAMSPTTTGQGTFGGSVPITFPNGVTSQSAIQQKIGATTYTQMYDGNSTSGSLSTHLEHGIVVTGSVTSGFGCAPSTNFAKAFTSSPTVVGTLSSGGYNYFVYPGAVSASAFTLCVYLASGGSGGPTSINWIAVGE